MTTTATNSSPVVSGTTTLPTSSSGTHSAAAANALANTQIAGNFQSFKGGKNAQLLAGIVDDAHFTRANSFINTDKLLGRTLIDGCPPKFTWHRHVATQYIAVRSS